MPRLLILEIGLPPIGILLNHGLFFGCLPSDHTWRWTLAGFMDRLAGARQRTWDGLHVSPRAAPSKGAKLCTYHHWFGRPNKVHCEPYYELPMSITRLRALVQFRLGSHPLLAEQGRCAMPSLPRHLRRCDLCNTQAVGDELHYVVAKSILASRRL